MSNSKEYRNLSKEEKFKLIKENLITRAESDAYSEYMNALEKDDFETVNYFESFGNRPYQFILNYRTFKQNALFGFECKNFDEYGWMERPVLLDKEDILVYVHKNGWKEENVIKVGRGINGKWTNGLHAQTNNGGHYSGASVWGEIFETKELAIISACKKMIKFHKENSWNNSLTVIKSAEEIIQTVLGNRPVQLSLF